MPGRKSYVMPQSTKDKISAIHSRKVKFKCDNCGNESEEKPSHYARKKRHFCCRACYTEYRKTKMTMEDHNSYKELENPVSLGRFITEIMLGKIPKILLI